MYVYISYIHVYKCVCGSFDIVALLVIENDTEILRQH